MIIVITALVSCKKGDINNIHGSVDMTAFGSVNSIKNIGGEIYLLNSSKSSIHKLNGTLVQSFQDIDINGRDFLLDFDIEGEKIYYSNTYDEIFISSGRSIEDTIKVLNPDRIAVIDSLLFVTSRKPEEGKVYLKLINIKNGKEISRTLLNDSLIIEMKFGQVSLAENEDGLWVLNPFRLKLEKYNSQLQLVSSFDLTAGYEYGNFAVQGNSIVIIASKDKKIVINTIIKNGKPESKTLDNINFENIDIKTSCVTKDKIMLYDFIELSIIF